MNIRTGVVVLQSIRGSNPGWVSCTNNQQKAVPKHWVFSCHQLLVHSFFVLRSRHQTISHFNAVTPISETTLDTNLDDRCQCVEVVVSQNYLLALHHFLHDAPQFRGVARPTEEVSGGHPVLGYVHQHVLGKNRQTRYIVVKATDSSCFLIVLVAQSEGILSRWVLNIRHANPSPTFLNQTFYSSHFKAVLFRVRFRHFLNLINW